MLFAEKRTPGGARYASLLLGLVLAASVPVPALAAVWLELTPASGVPGTEVQVDLKGATPNPDGADMALFLVHDADLSAHLMPDTRTAEVRSHEEVIALGRSLERDEEGNASATIIIPEVPAGSYAVFFDCVPCPPGSAFAFGAELEVREAPRASVGRLDPGVLVVAVVLLAGGVFVARLRQRPADPG